MNERKKSLFECYYKITNENWEVIKCDKLMAYEIDLSNAEAYFHDVMVDKMGRVDGADDYYLEEMRKVA